MRSRHAFTLVELLVVIGIIAVLISILLPVVGSARRQAGAVKCQTQLREIGTCFRLYENDNRGYYPVARINGTAVGKFYMIDGFTYNGTTTGHAYWFNLLAKYATKAKMGGAAALSGSASEGQLSRQTIFFGCPAFEGYLNGGTTTLVGDTNVVQVGYGMNAYPSFVPNKFYASYPPTAENAIINPNDPVTAWGRFPRSRAYLVQGSQRMLLADGKLWLMASGRAPVQSSYPPAVVAQPEFSNTTAGTGDVLGSAPTQTLVDLYRHGKYPRPVNGKLDPNGGKVSYNILYADGHVAQHADGREAYYSFRLRFPG